MPIVNNHRQICFLENCISKAQQFEDWRFLLRSEKFFQKFVIKVRSYIVIAIVTVMSWNMFWFRIFYAGNICFQFSSKMDRTYKSHGLNRKVSVPEFGGQVFLSKILKLSPVSEFMFVSAQLWSELCASAISNKITNKIINNFCILWTKWNMLSVLELLIKWLYKPKLCLVLIFTVILEHWQ